MIKRIILYSSFLGILLVLLIIAYFIPKFRADYNPGTRPLPILSHFTDAFSTQELAMIQRGHHLSIDLPLFSKTSSGKTALRGFDIQTILEAQRQNLPLSFPSTQWDGDLLESPYRDIDATNGVFTGTRAMDSNNPLFIKTNNTIVDELDPFGPAGQIDFWREVGGNWASSKVTQFIESIYPNPPKINFLSNNENSLMRWAEIGPGDNSAIYSKRYQELYSNTGRDTGMDQSTLYNFRRRVTGDGWIDRFGVMIDSFRNGLVNQNWKNNSIFTAYTSFGPSYFGRWWGWSSNGHNDPTTYTVPDLISHSDTVPRISPYPYAWDGSSEEVYLAPYYALTDFNAMSPQIESQNWIFMLEETYRRKPNYQFELITWDGHKPLCSADIPSGSGYCCNTLTASCDRRTAYASWGQTWTPARYAAMVQYSMWLTRPNSVREFRFPLQTWDSELPYFLALTKTVDRVYNIPTLTDFWQNGTLVENRSKNHPYNLIEATEGYTNTTIRNMYGLGRWYMLNTNLDPSLPWLDFTTNPDTNKEIPVYSMALTKGTAPNREWLVYAHSPRENRQNVIISIPLDNTTTPQVKNITVDVTTAGNFYHVYESSGQVTAVNDAAAQLTHLVISPDNALVNTGQIQQFTVKGLDQYDQDFSIGGLVWSATGGSINQNGLYTAPSVSGDYKIGVSLGNVSNSITVKVGNLAGKWDFNEQAGSLTNDISGRDHHCMFINSSWGTDGNHKYANFTGGAGGLITCDTDDTILTPQEISVSAWVKLDELMSADGSRYIAATAEGSQANVYSLKYTRETSRHLFMFSVGDSGESHPVRSGSLNIEAGKWYFVTGAYKPASYMRMYVNGILQQEITTNLPTEVGNLQPDFYIGKDFVGKIDEVAVYNQALSEQEIKNLYAEKNLNIVKSVDKASSPSGQIVTYTITYQNTSNEVFQNAVITDVLNPRAHLIATPPGSTVSGQTITWNIASIPANSPLQTITFRCRLE